MKNLKMILTLMLGVTLIFISCNDDDNVILPLAGGVGGGEHMSAKIDGANWVSQQDFGDLISATETNGLLAVQGGDNSGNTMRINIANYTGVQTYATGDNVSNSNSLSYISVLPFGSWMSTFDVGTGTIDITSDANGIVEGTFSFTGYNSTDMTNKVITTGAFKANKE